MELALLAAPAEVALAANGVGEIVAEARALARARLVVAQVIFAGHPLAKTVGGLRTIVLIAAFANPQLPAFNKHVRY